MLLYCHVHPRGERMKTPFEKKCKFNKIDLLISKEELK
jgi:hypothetical protein